MPTILELADKLDEESDAAEKSLSVARRIDAAASEISMSASRSWIGFHSLVYLKDFRPIGANDYFDREWGFSSLRFNRTRGNWVVYERQQVAEKIQQLAGLTDEQIASWSGDAGDKKPITLPRQLYIAISAASAAHHADGALKAIAAEAERLSKPFELDPASAFIQERDRPGEGWLTRDLRAERDGILAPPHRWIQAACLVAFSEVEFARLAAKNAREAAIYLQSIQDGANLPAAVASGPEVDMDQESKALAVLAKHPDWTKAMIAEKVGVNRTQLYRFKKFIAATKAIKATNAPKRGSKINGMIEVADDD